MTTRKEALQALLDKIDAGDADQHDEGWMHLPCTRHDDGKMSSHMGRAWRAYHGSLDAALALHNAVLPGWRWWVADALYWSVMDDEAPRVTLANGIPGADLHVVSAHSETCPARAWLIAIIKALISECDT